VDPTPLRIPRTLVVTNDLPPRHGGIQQYVHNLLSALPGREALAVLAPRWEGWRGFDAQQPFEIRRWPSETMWPTRELAARVRSMADEHRAEVVLFGHGLPLSALGPGLARRGIPYIVITHGAEHWMALAPGAAFEMKRATSLASRVTVISNFTGRTIRTVVPDRIPVSMLPPGVDVERFRPGIDVEAVRERHGLGHAPLIVCVSRLVARKGQDTLIRAMTEIRARAPGATLLIVGDGGIDAKLRRLAEDKAPSGSVVFAGAVSEEELPAYHCAADVFAMPCRSRYGGLEVEGFGIVFMEAAACGKPVVAGDSGGAAEAVVAGETGLVVDGRETGEVAEAVSRLLVDRERAEEMGRRGRLRAEEHFAWPMLARRMAMWLMQAAAYGPPVGG
jgi:phosphatidylinositol alpha-1,6-mannosyltransferase